MAAPHPGEPIHIPVSTYRLQLNRDFTFRQAAGLVDYLHRLGVGDCYLSPILMASPGSPHGYDVTNHQRLNPDIGTLEDFRELSRQLKNHGLGMIADVVPNHMSTADPSNEWWWDILENGPSSEFARYFDIDWHPPKIDMQNKVLCPILGDQYGRVLEEQQIAVIDCVRGGFCISVYDKALPLAARTWPVILQPALDRLRDQLGPDHEHVLELESIVRSLNLLVPSGDSDEPTIRERQHETEIVRRRLVSLAEASEAARNAIEGARQEINGTRGVPRSFDRLEALLAQQSYRLCYWRVASDEINYRRFFDVNELVAIRVEEPEVFAAVHALLFDLMREGHIDGLRVDHPDGLLDPAEYFRRLQAGCISATGKAQPFYVVGEKILTGDERLHADWDIEGTTGYDFLGVLNRLFVDRNRRRAFQRLYHAFTGEAPSYSDLVYGCKKLILQTTMSSELNLLTNKLDRISEQHRWSRDFTRQSLRHALRETISCFPVYRTYTTEMAARVNPDDERHVRTAIALAKHRNPSTSESIFDFLQSVLLLDDPGGIDAAEKIQRRRFVLSFQQLTGPVMAKGLEDTAFYRQAPLVSLNEVGGDLHQFGAGPEDFHALNLHHLASWPNTQLATSTHDSKRSEDARARIHVLSEIPGDWYRALRRWYKLNRPYKREMEGAEVPSLAEEYLLYQDLIGIWPLQEPSPDEYEKLCARFYAHVRKTLREAKLHTSWINPNEPYEEAVESFVRAILDPKDDNRFLRDFRSFAATLFAAGMWNSLSQVVLKIASPGVPDFYQGSELWNFSLVDPDNRRPVDYALRQCLLKRLDTAEPGGAETLIEQLLRQPEDGAVKLYITSRGLRFRQQHHAVLSKGAYVPLRAAGARQNHVVAFARTLGNQAVIAAAGRFFMELGAATRPPVGADSWGDSVLTLRRELRGQTWRDVFTHRTLEAEVRKGKPVIPLASLFGSLPVALLVSTAN